MGKNHLILFHEEDRIEMADRTPSVEIIVIYWMSVQEHGRKDQTVLSRTNDLSLKTRPPPTWEQPIIYISSVTVDPNQLTKVQQKQR